MDNLTLAQETNDILYSRVVGEAENIIVGGACLLFRGNGGGTNIARYHQIIRGFSLWLHHPAKSSALKAPVDFDSHPLCIGVTLSNRDKVNQLIHCFPV